MITQDTIARVAGTIAAAAIGRYAGSAALTSDPSPSHQAEDITLYAVGMAIRIVNAIEQQRPEPKPKRPRRR